MATIPTTIGPIGARQINRYFYVGQSDLTTIQKAVNAAIAMGAGTVIIPQEYAGTDSISAITNGIPSVFIMDERNGQRQVYIWYVNAYLQEGINTPGIGTAVFNHYIWVGPLGKYPTIQSAVNQAVQVGIMYVVVIPFNYAGTDTIAAVTGGSTNVDILDLRYGQTQTYIWNGNQYVAATFQQRAALVSMGIPPSTPPASAAFYFDPTGTAGAGTAHINVTANPGAPMPAFEVIGIPSDSTPQQIFFRCNISGTGQFPVAGLPQVEMPCQLGLFNGDINNFNLWTGGGYIAGSKGMTIWAKAAEDAIDFQGQTIGGAYDQTIRLNYLGGNVEIGPITFDGAGNIIGIAAIEATSIGASTIVSGVANFTECEVDNSPVRTFANTPGGPGQGMVWPTAGIPVSLGDQWQDPSIAVASLATWPPAGIPVSTGTGWGSSIAPASIAFQPAAGVPVSTGTGWTTSIPLAVVPRTDMANTFTQPLDAAKLTQAGIPVVVTNPTVATTIDVGWNNFHLMGSAPAAVSGNASNPPTMAFTQIEAATGQNTTGTTGQTAGWGAQLDISGGGGGAAPAGSTNGAGGALFLSGGRAGQGAGTAGTAGGCYINANWGDTYIGGQFPTGNVKIGYGGAFSAYANMGSGFTPPYGSGLSIVWNVKAGTGETDFINSRSTVGGGFNWYNVAPSTLVNSSTPAAMILDSSNCLTTAGGLIANGGAPINITATSVTNRVSGSGAIVHFINAAAPADQKYSDIVATTGALVFRFYNDTITTASSWLNVVRSAQLCTSVSFATPQLLVTGNPGNAQAGISLQANSTSATATLLSSSNGNLSVTAGGGGGNLLLNWERPAGTIFGNGTNGGYHASISVAGDANFASLNVSGAKNFRITHPLDDSKLLYHGTVEAPEYALLYRGEGVTSGGWAEITLPDYFEALTMKDNRSVLLTPLFDKDDEPISTLAASRVKTGKFKVWSALPAQKFYWEVKAVRADIEPLIVERNKEDDNDEKLRRSMQTQAEEKPDERTQ